MKHVGCYIGEYSGLFIVQYKQTSEAIISRYREGIKWIPTHYRLKPLQSEEIYYVDIMEKETSATILEGMQVEVSFDFKLTSTFT